MSNEHWDAGEAFLDAEDWEEEEQEETSEETGGCAFEGARNVTCPKCLSGSPFHELDPI